MPITKGKLTPEDRSCIDQNYSFILEELDAKYVVDRFIDAGIFDQNDSEIIRSTATRLERNRAFLHCLFESGPGAYEVFKDILQNTGYEFVADRLNATTLKIPERVKPRGEVLNDELTDDLKAFQLQEIDLLYFAKSFSGGIFTVASGLGISKIEVEQIQISNQFGSAIVHNHNMLVKWKHKTGKAATLAAFMDALTVADCAGTIDWGLVEDGISAIKKKR